MTSDETMTDQKQVIDLTGFPSHMAEPSPERLVEWLRSSGGPLGDRLMKRAAADLIEKSLHAGS